MSQVDTFTCEVRERAGKGGARAVRRDGWVPGVLYGGDKEPVNIKLRFNEVLKAYLNGKMISHLAKIKVGKEEQQVIARDVQVDPVKDMPVHVDLMRVDEKTRINVDVTVHFINEETCPGIKAGGVLNIVRHSIEVYAPATQIPEAFEIDLAGLEIGDVIHVSSIKMPEGVELTVTDRDFTVATIAAPSAVRSASDSDEGADEAETVEAEEDEAEDTEE